MMRSRGHKHKCFANTSWHECTNHTANPLALLQQVEKEAQDKKQAEADKRKQEQQAKKDAEAKVSVQQTALSAVFVAG